MPGLRWVLLVLLLLPWSSAQVDPAWSSPEPRIVAVVPNMPGSEPGDEAIAIYIPPRFVAGNWSITDGEGTFHFGVDSAGLTWLTGHLGVARAHGIDAKIQWPPGTLGLANSGDDLVLQQGATIWDEVRWGNGWPLVESASWVHLRQVDATGTYIDTDTPQDFVGPRVHRLGESMHPSPRFQVDSVQPILFPDHGYASLKRVIESSEERLAIHAYEWLDVDLARVTYDHLVRTPNLRAGFLQDGGVVGQSPAEAETQRRIAGAFASLGHESVLTERGRFTFHHLKTLIADDTVVIQTENLGDGSISTHGGSGNRGWGVILESEALADFLWDVLASDRAAWDTVDVAPATLPPRSFERVPNYLPHPTASVIPGPIDVQLLLSPEHTAYPDRDLVLERIRSAQDRIWAQQLQLGGSETSALGWAEEDRYMVALAGKLRESNTIDVRIQATPPFSEDDQRNLVAVETLERMGAHAELWNHPQLTLHNKGWIIDDTVILGSQNGRHPSRSNNRELGILIEDARVADVFEGWFLADQPNPANLLPLPGTLFVALVLWMAGRRR